MAPPGTIFKIVDNDLGDPVQGEFASLPEGRHVIHQGVEYEVSYRGGDGNDVTLRVVRTGAVPSLRIDDVTVTEGPGRQAAFRVTLDPIVYGNPTVQVTTAGGTARQPEDFTAASTRIMFGELDSEMRFLVTVRDDVEVEDVERGFVRLSAPVGATIADGEGALTILDDEARPAARVSTGRREPGYWMVANDGGMFTFVSATFAGSAAGSGATVAGMAVTPSRGGKPLNKPIVGMASTPSGGGYWLVASDGGIFTFGDAAFLGSTGDLRLNRPIVGIAI